MAKKKKAKKRKKAKAAAPPPMMPVEPDDVTLEIIDAEAGKQIVRSNIDGRFQPGTHAGGRPKGSVDGIALVRALFGKHLGEMSLGGKEFDKLLKELRKSKGGVWRLFKMGLAASRDEERAKSGIVNVQGATSINIVIVEETPPAKLVASHVVESGGNGKAN